MTEQAADLVERLAKALASHADDVAPELVADAVEAARQEVAGILRSAAKQALLASALTRLEEAAAAEAGESQAAQTTQPQTAEAGESQAAQTTQPQTAEAGESQAVQPQAPERGDVRASAQPDPQDCHGWYIYGITTEGTPLPDGPATGIDGAALRAIDVGPLRGVVSEVDTGAFAEGALAGEQADPVALERRVRDHDGALRVLAAAGPLIPLRFGTVVADESDVRALLERHTEGLERALARLDGAAEWGVKGYWDHTVLHADVAPALGNGDRHEEAAGGGTDYLVSKRRKRERAQEAQRVRDAVLAACHERLSALARDAALLPLRQASAEPDEAALVLNGSYLVDGEGVDGFRAAVAKLSDEHAGAGLALELTGPWPPYSFVGPDALGAGGWGT